MIENGPVIKSDGKALRKNLSSRCSSSLFVSIVVQKDGNARLIRVSQAGVYAKLNNFVIPATVEYNGVSYTVTSIDGGAFGDWEMETLGIPSTVTSIASNAFSSIKTINTDLAQPTDTALPAGWEFDATNITINYGQTLS